MRIGRSSAPIGSTWLNLNPNHPVLLPVCLPPSGLSRGEGATPACWPAGPVINSRISSTLRLPLRHPHGPSWTFPRSVIFVTCRSLPCPIPPDLFSVARRGVPPFSALLPTSTAPHIDEYDADPYTFSIPVQRSGRAQHGGHDRGGLAGLSGHSSQGPPAGRGAARDPFRSVRLR